LNAFPSQVWYHTTVRGDPFECEQFYAHISNIFMTIAWYGHLKFRSEALWKVIMSAGDRFLRILFPSAREPHRLLRIHRRELKTIQEIITLSIFPVFSVVYLGDKFKWNYGVGFAFIVIAAFFIFHKW